MMKFFCYTTVFDAIELFSAVRTAGERRSVEDAMSAMKILGLNAKFAPRYGDLFPANRSLTALQVLIAGICLETRLPLLTSKVTVFRRVKGLSVIPVSALSPEANAAEILSRKIVSGA
jgi:predicted nucleic acid-binding protein